jgi:hypothetical protein
MPLHVPSANSNCARSSDISNEDLVVDVILLVLPRRTTLPSGSTTGVATGVADSNAGYSTRLMQQLLLHGVS